MPLHLSTNSSTLVRLNKDKYHDDVTNLANAKREKKAADAASRGAETVIKALTSKLMLAMNGAVSAVCGQAVLTVKPGVISPAALTLADGRKVPWASVVGVIVGNTTIPREYIKTLYGGREAGDSIDVTGT
jgi:hypothetical protein